MSKELQRHENPGITREELGAMLEKYNIGKKPLSKLLGWGETTILLYLRENGEEIPDNEYTRRLKDLYTHTTSYLELLNSAQDRVSAVTKRKSIEAIRELYPRTPVIAAAEYISLSAERDAADGPGEPVSLLRIETILFWSQIISLCLYGEPIFDDDYAPCRTGLPYRAVEERILDVGCIIPKGLFDDGDAVDEMLSSQQREILDYVRNMFDWYGVSALSALMEAEHFRLCGPKTARRRRFASKEMLRKCYGEVFFQARVKKLRDVDDYMLKRMAYIRSHKDK